MMGGWTVWGVGLWFLGGLDGYLDVGVSVGGGRSYCELVRLMLFVVECMYEWGGLGALWKSFGVALEIEFWSFIWLELIARLSGAWFVFGGPG